MMLMQTLKKIATGVSQLNACVSGRIVGQERALQVNLAITRV
jgi:hypothetical protein